MTHSRRQSSTVEDRHRDRLEPLPPSAKLVYLVLTCEGSLTQQGLASETMLSPRTVRHALNELADRELIQSDIYIPDARKDVYRVAVEE
jgi:DNA-binding transcriptional ArsR family regulator